MPNMPKIMLAYLVTDDNCVAKVKEVVGHVLVRQVIYRPEPIMPA